MKKNNRFYVTNIGTTSLLMIFIMLCMVIFTLLSLSEATRDYNFSEKMATHNTQYYEASNLAYEQLAAVNEASSKGENLQKAALPDVKKYSAKAGNVTFSVPVSSSLSLEVRLLPDRKNGGHYTIDKFKEVHTKEWKGDNKLNLMK